MAVQPFSLSVIAVISPMSGGSEAEGDLLAFAVGLPDAVLQGFALEHLFTAGRAEVGQARHGVRKGYLRTKEHKI
jgi:hypothetical protein